MLYHHYDVRYASQECTIQSSTVQRNCIEHFKLEKKLTTNKHNTNPNYSA